MSLSRFIFALKYLSQLWISAAGVAEAGRGLAPRGGGRRRGFFSASQAWNCLEQRRLPAQVFRFAPLRAARRSSFMNSSNLLRARHCWRASPCSSSHFVAAGQALPAQGSGRARRDLLPTSDGMADFAGFGKLG